MNVAAANSRRRSFHFVAPSLFGSQCRRQLSAAATYFATRRKKTEDLSGKTPILRTKVTKIPSSDARLMPLGSRGSGVRGWVLRKKRLSFLNRFFGGSRGSRTPDAGKPASFLLPPVASRQPRGACRCRWYRHRASPSSVFYENSVLRCAADAAW